MPGSNSSTGVECPLSLFDRDWNLCPLCRQVVQSATTHEQPVKEYPTLNYPDIIQDLKASALRNPQVGKTADTHPSHVVISQVLAPSPKEEARVQAELTPL